MDNKWDSIKTALLAFICIFGLVTCHGIDTYSMVRIREAEALKQKYSADEARAKAEILRLQKTQEN